MFRFCKNAFIGLLFLLVSSLTVRAEIVSTDLWALTELNGDFNWAETDYNHGYSYSDELNNTVHLDTVDGLMKDGYEFSSGGGEINYNGIATDSKEQSIVIEFNPTT